VYISAAHCVYVRAQPVPRFANRGVVRGCLVIADTTKNLTAHRDTTRWKIPRINPAERDGEELWKLPSFIKSRVSIYK